MGESSSKIVSTEDVRKVAKLARLQVGDRELSKLVTELNSILGYVQQLEEVNVEGVEAMSHVHGSFNVTREDKVEPSLPVDALLKNAPDKSGRFIRVPIIVE